MITSLRIRIYSILTALVVITLLGCSVMIWYSYRIENLLINVVNHNINAFQIAESLEIALVNQKGLVSYYLLDSNPDWLKQLEQYRITFKDNLKLAKTLADSKEQSETLDSIESLYLNYVRYKDQVLDYYKNGDKDPALQLHKKVRQIFFQILDLCEQNKTIHKNKIDSTIVQSHNESNQLRLFSVSVIILVMFLASILGVILIHNILTPIRNLIFKASRQNISDKSKNEVHILTRSISGLIEKFDHTNMELEKSREYLQQAEKMNVIAKLAAGTAHSIRNPLTSVQMRLFSLRRSLDLAQSQKEDFDVISYEIHHIDTIVQNFLEFSRPPKLKMQKISPSNVVDTAIRLLEQRLNSYNVTIEVDRKTKLPEIQADPEQLKEVLINIIVNACEAMEKTGHIIISESVHYYDTLDKVVYIRIKDNGPGIAKGIQHKIFEPFYTTKEEGTGLGLSIAARIIEEHGGSLDVESVEAYGATFIISLPILGLT